jgi:hypothetical protein
MRPFAVVFLSFVAMGAHTAAADVVLSSCGQVIPEGTVARLAADLDCSATSVGGAFLGAGATLDLAGFALRGNPGAPFGTHGVTCAGPCTLLGPGSVEDFAGDGIFSDQHAAIRVLGATIEGSRFRGIETLGHVTLVDAVFGGNSGESVYTGGPVTAKNTTFVGNGGGISGLGVKVSDSMFVGNGVAVNADAKATVRRSSFTSNGIGIQGYKIACNTCTVDAGNTGINGNLVKITSSQITDAVLDGIDAVRLRIFQSSVTGSGSGCTDPQFPCADLATREMPVVVDTTCDRSLAWQTHQPWGVCSLD